MGLYEVLLPMSLLGFGVGTMLANFHMCGIMLVLREVFNMLVRNASPRGPISHMKHHLDKNMKLLSTFTKIKQFNF